MGALVNTGIIGGLLLATLAFPVWSTPLNIESRLPIGEFGRGPGQFRSPGHVAELRGVLYVVDSRNRRIQRFGRSNQFLSVFEWVRDAEGERIGMEEPYGIAVDPSGRVYVSDAEADLIYQYTLDGQFERSLGEFGSFGVRFNRPTGLDVDFNGFLFVADTGNQRILQLDNNGRRVREISALGGQVLAPLAVKAMPEGMLYVLDDKGVVLFNQFGTYLGRKLEYEGGSDFDMDRLGNYYISSKTNRETVVYSPDGELIERFTGFSAKGIFKGATMLYVSDGGRHAVRLFKVE